MHLVEEHSVVDPTYIEDFLPYLPHFPARPHGGRQETVGVVPWPQPQGQGTIDILTQALKSISVDEMND